MEVLISNDTECDQNANTGATEIMQRAFDDTTECLISFRQRVRTEVNSSIKNIREVKKAKSIFFLYFVFECSLLF